MCNICFSSRWSYFLGGLISGVVLFLGWSYFWVVLFLGWSYFWGGLISGWSYFKVVLFMGWSYFWDGLKAVFLSIHVHTLQCKCITQSESIIHYSLCMIYAVIIHHTLFKVRQGFSVFMHKHYNLSTLFKDICTFSCFLHKKHIILG